MSKVKKKLRTTKWVRFRGKCNILIESMYVWRSQTFWEKTYMYSLWLFCKVLSILKKSPFYINMVYTNLLWKVESLWFDEIVNVLFSPRKYFSHVVHLNLENPDVHFVKWDGLKETQSKRIEIFSDFEYKRFYFYFFMDKGQM